MPNTRATGLRRKGIKGSVFLYPRPFFFILEFLRIATHTGSSVFIVPCRHINDIDRLIIFFIKILAIYGNIRLKYLIAAKNES